VRVGSGCEFVVAGWLFAGEAVGGAEVGLGQGAGVKFALVGRVETVEFGFHIFHVGLLGDHAVAVGVHEEEEFFDVLFAESEAVLGFGDGRFLSGGGAKNGDDDEKDESGKDEFSLGGEVAHQGLLGDDVPGMKGMYNVAGWNDYAKNG